VLISCSPQISERDYGLRRRAAGFRRISKSDTHSSIIDLGIYSVLREKHGKGRGMVRLNEWGYSCPRCRFWPPYYYGGPKKVKLFGRQVGLFLKRGFLLVNRRNFF